MKYTAHVLTNKQVVIEGSTLEEAIGNNIFMLAKKAGLGNAAGVTYDRVYYDWKDGILGGKGGVELSITAHGSDLLINYNPITDVSKTKLIWFDIPKKEAGKLPCEYDISASKKEETPFDKPENVAQAYGYYCAICDEIASNHARVPVKKNVLGGVCANIDQRFPNAKLVNPYKYIELIQQSVQRSYPKSDTKTKELIEKANELALILMDANKEQLAKAANDGEGFFHMVHASRWFEKENKITALAFYRNKAGMTGKQLAEAVGISDRQIRKYESTDSALGNAKNTIVENIAKALNVKPTDLVEDGIAKMVDAES